MYQDLTIKQTSKTELWKSQWKQKLGKPPKILKETPSKKASWVPSIGAHYKLTPTAVFLQLKLKKSMFETCEKMSMSTVFSSSFSPLFGPSLLHQECGWHVWQECTLTLRQEPPIFCFSIRKKSKPTWLCTEQIKFKGYSSCIKW